MNDNEIMTEIEAFIRPEGDSNKRKFRKRLKDSIQFMQSLGVGINDTPTEVHYEKLKAYLESLSIKPSKKNEDGKYKPQTISEWLSTTRKFYNRNTQKGEQQMTMAIPTATPDITADTELLSAEPEQTEQAEAPSPVEAIRKAGRPRTTNRTAKFTLYMTDELMRKVNMLADYDEINATELMNSVLEDYCDNVRAEDMNFLYEFERRKKERRLQKARERQ